jgi:AcrR family transcriptional regulator
VISGAAERARAVRLARHYRDAERLSIDDIAARLGRSPATIREYLYDPDRSKATALRQRYRGVCRDCGASTSGNGPARSRARCARCNGAASAKWSRERIEEALRAWQARYGAPARNCDLSMTYARRHGGERLRRLQAGWKGGSWPAASVVQYHFGSVRAANQAALTNSSAAG